MADLSVRPAQDGRAGRGQIILIAGFALAVALLALALVMNAAIYTENIATRSETADAANAHAYQRATENAAGEAFTYAHEVDNGSNAELEANVSDAMRDYFTVTARHEARDGRIVDGDVETVHGTNITGGDGGFFTDSTSSADWTLASEVSRARGFTVHVDTAGSLAGPGDDEFRVLAEDASDTWAMNLTYDDTTSTVTLGVEHSGGYETCTTTSGSADGFAVNLSAGTAFGEECGPLNLSDTPDSYHLRFGNADRIQGEYSLVVDRVVDPTDPDSDVVDDSYGDGPRTRDHLYSMTVDVVYQTDDVSYESDVRTAPGEGDV